MNKIFITIFVVVVTTTTVFSQTKGINEFSVNVGYNASTGIAAGIFSSSYRSGFNAGVSIDHYFSKTWSIKSGVTYNQKGWDDGFWATGSGSNKTNFKLDYLTIPVKANWHFGRTKNWYLNFGPYVGFLLTATESTGGENVKPFFNTVDGGVDVGIGIKFPVSNHTKFFIELNGQGGISDIYKGAPSLGIRNNVSNVNIGFSF